MAAPDLQLVSSEESIRRFGVADLSSHGKWMMPRFLKAYPHLTERDAASFLHNIVYNNEYLFLHLPNGVAVAQVMSAQSLTGQAIVYERLVWAKDPQDKAQVEAVAEFYTEIRKWAKQMGVEVMIVGEITDVPTEIIKAKLGRVFNRQQQYVRL